MIQSSTSKVQLDATRQSAPAAGSKSETPDPFLDCFVVKQSVTFDTPISMEQLAKAMTTNVDGSISFNFGSIPGAHSSK